VDRSRSLQNGASGAIFIVRKLIVDKRENTVMSAKTIPQEQLLMLADTCLLWGHRISQWCGHGPALEEDIALTNTALDVIGHARSLYQLVARREPSGSVASISEDTLAYFREPQDFQNVSLAEWPNGDYAQTIVRSLFLSAWFVPLWEQLAGANIDNDVRSIAIEAIKASRAQLRHATDWVIRFGDGTEESRARVEDAIRALLPHVNSMLSARIDGAQQTEVATHWRAIIDQVFVDATLDTLPPKLPSNAVDPTRQHRTELLADMQSVARQYPNAVW
jgi:ring-1,2-phenylacetyl-CoA epoxidase subunit PaaC